MLRLKKPWKIKKTKWNQMMKHVNIWKLNELDQIY
jgi:hypothetical protein